MTKDNYPHHPNKYRFNPDRPTHEQLSDRKFHEAIENALEEMFARTVSIVETLPDDIDEEKHATEIATVNAIEEEWFLDEIDRLEHSVLGATYTDNEGNTMDQDELVQLLRANDPRHVLPFDEEEDYDPLPDLSLDTDELPELRDLGINDYDDDEELL